MDRNRMDWKFDKLLQSDVFTLVDGFILVLRLYAKF